MPTFRETTGKSCRVLVGPQDLRTESVVESSRFLQSQFSGDQSFGERLYAAENAIRRFFQDTLSEMASGLQHDLSPRCTVREAQDLVILASDVLCSEKRISFSLSQIAQLRETSSVLSRGERAFSIQFAAERSYKLAAPITTSQMRKLKMRDSICNLAAPLGLLKFKITLEFRVYIHNSGQQ